MAVMARETWTDERLDDLKEHMDNGSLIAALIGLVVTHYLG
jgi:hypothetical protein